ncbi:MAG TPA: ZIP family metal transporter [Gemmatimonadales bacterium]|nr:ZIP family metal transporter [Gemmatimonadales bacterium]
MSAVGFAVAAATGNLAGALAVVRRLEGSLRAIDVGIAFSAGFMLSVAIIGVLPYVFAQSGASAAWYVLGGYVAVHVAQHVLAPHFHFGEETHRVSAAAGIIALVGLAVHTFFDGVAIAAGFLSSGRLGVLLALSVLLHKLPEGVTVASIMVAGGHGRRGAIAAAAAVGLATVLGVLLTEAIAPLARHGLALSAGVTLYVAASELVPAFQSQRRSVATVAFGGGILAFLTANLLV